MNATCERFDGSFTGSNCRAATESQGSSTSPSTIPASGTDRADIVLERVWILTMLETGLVDEEYDFMYEASPMSSGILCR